jgi:hypothetical protein
MTLRQIIRMKMVYGSKLPRNCDFRACWVISDTGTDVYIMCRYWDWADKDVPENGLPPVLYKEKVEIVAAGGKKQIVGNPLSFFSYVGGVPSDFSDEKDDTVGYLSLSRTLNSLKCGL